MLFASDFEGTTPETLQYLNSIIDTLGGNVHFVHVERDDTSSTYKEIEQRIFNILFESGEPHYSFTMSKVEGPDVVEALSTYADQHGIDLIILVHPHRSFWESIFHKSVTRAMALNSRIPLMVLPLEKTAAEKQG
ncbi:MAG: hypothetical protein KatS3mg029_0640 [Saprospiraceae bacterium]|nr:MAG: hypothetical protein KatS3mg029_0640 [Saprospiraceae bacterium]